MQFLPRFVATILIWAILIAGSIVPYWIIRKKRQSPNRAANFILSLCNCFSAGIFLSTCFLGLLPHVREHVLRINSQDFNGSGSTHDESHSRNSASVTGKLPIDFAEILLICGFLLTAFLEQLVHMCHEKSERKRRLREQALSDLPTTPCQFEAEALLSDEEISDPKPASLLHDIGGGHNHNHNHSSGGGHHHHHVVNLGPSESLTFQSVMLLFGISIHSLFEGVALGVQEDSTAFGKLLFGVLSHEILCAIAFGIQMANLRPCTAFFASLIFSLMIPLGIGLGGLLALLPGAFAAYLRAILEGIAAGTFVYVVCMEMLPMEFAEPNSRRNLMKVIFVTIGFGVFLLVQLLI